MTMNERRARKSAPTATEPPSPDGLATPSSPSVTNEPNLPPIAADADDLEAIKKPVDDAAAVGGGLWLSYLFVLFYLAVAAGAVTHADLFFENPVKLPFLNIELPLLAFFFLAPILFVIVHAYTLLHLVMLAEKAKRFHRALNDPERKVIAETREDLQWQLPSNIFIQFLAGPEDLREKGFGRALRAIAWITLVIAPVLLLLMMQIQFLPYHSRFVTWTLRVALGLDLVLIWWLWGRILSGREVDGGRRLAAWAWPPLGLALSVAVLLFSVTVVTFPGEWQEELPSWRILPAMDEWGNPATETDASDNPRKAFRDWVVNARRVSLHDWLFNAKPDPVTRRRLPFSSTLVLTDLNVYEGLKIDDPEKVKGRDFVFSARGRDLKGAIFDLASLPKVDFEGAKLQGASLERAQLQGASFAYAELQGASLFGARLQGASLDNTQLQGALLDSARLQGASLFLARLPGASLDDAQLQGAFLVSTQLQGASLFGARLQGASLDSARLQGASLFGAQLQGVSLADAQLQGASLSGADLHAADFSTAFLWRCDCDGPDVAAPKLSDSSDQWRPVWRNDDGQIQSWDNNAYQKLRQVIQSLPPGGPRDRALKRVRILDCENPPAEPDLELASCEASVPRPPEGAERPESLKKGRIDDAAHAKALAAELRTLVCSGDDDSIYGLRGLLRSRRLAAVGAAAPALIDFIMSKDCPVSASLTDADKARLLQIKRHAIKEAGQ
ncbi:Uncharacterized protein YjbI, contains pentapeptide repeats [Rhizobiales bacterium GAS113]|nr:Uncharacterized protein YjbI, contains pentapeptide repeats [Rhizobiales bacterium GAS113]